MPCYESSVLRADVHNYLAPKEENFICQVFKQEGLLFQLILLKLCYLNESAIAVIAVEILSFSWFSRGRESAKSLANI